MLGVPKSGCFKPGCHAIFTHKRSFAPFCALANRALWSAFACFCVRPRLERPRLGTSEDECFILGGFFRVVFPGTEQHCMSTRMSIHVGLFLQRFNTPLR